MAISFHWRLLQGGEQGIASRASGAVSQSTGLPDLERQIAFAKVAEDAGIDGLLVDIGAECPDPILMCTALGMATKRIKLIIAVRSGLIPPTTFVQKINTLSALIGGDRILLNIVAGDSPIEQRFYGDFLNHDERYARTEDYLAVCRGLWQKTGPLNYKGPYFRVEGAKLNTPFVADHRDHPYMFVAGGSEPCLQVSATQGSCWMTLAHSPDTIAERGKQVLAAGKDIGLRMGIICRPTRDEALTAARDLVAGIDPTRKEKTTEADFIKGSDSVSLRSYYALADKEWLTPTLWMGAVRSHGAPAISLVGDAKEIAEAIMEYGRIGVTQYILSGWPKQDEMVIFGREVIPLIREMERREALRSAS